MGNLSRGQFDWSRIPRDTKIYAASLVRRAPAGAQTTDGQACVGINARQDRQVRMRDSLILEEFYQALLVDNDLTLD